MTGKVKGSLQKQVSEQHPVKQFKSSLVILLNFQDLYNFSVHFGLETVLYLFIVFLNTQFIGFVKSAVFSWCCFCTYTFRKRSSALGNSRLSSLGIFLRFPWKPDFSPLKYQGVVAKADKLIRQVWFFFSFPTTFKWLGFFSICLSIKNSFVLA